VSVCLPLLYYCEISSEQSDANRLPASNEKIRINKYNTKNNTLRGVYLLKRRV